MKNYISEAGLEQHHSYVLDVEIDEVIGFVSDVTAEVAS